MALAETDAYYQDMNRKYSQYVEASKALHGEEDPTKRKELKKNLLEALQEWRDALKVFRSHLATLQKKIKPKG